MKPVFSYESCPRCGAGVRTVNGKMARHERGMCWQPYRLYHAISRMGGKSVKELAAASLCK